VRIQLSRDRARVGVVARASVAGGVIGLVPHEPTAAESLAIGTERYRSGFVAVAERLAELGGLREGLEVEEAVDVLWFYFRYSAPSTG
jgi:hypothetical protein